jgi:two-component system chemotaxis response regulator CheB
VAGPLPIVIVDDSGVQRRFAKAALEASAEFEIVGEARNGKEAVALVQRLRPAAVLMDLDLPVMSGIEAIEAIMAISPTPILVFSGVVNGSDRANALASLAAGAVDVLPKPGAIESGTLDDHADELRRRMRVAARIRVITHPRGRLRSTDSSSSLAAGAPGMLTPERAAPVKKTPGAWTATLAQPELQARPDVRLIAIGASTGGPLALLNVLSHLPADLEQAVLVVQHMAEGFVPGLATWLDELVPLSVRVGGSGRKLEPGTVTIAPGGGNLVVSDARMRTLCVPPEPGQFHVPGIDASLTSVADCLGPDAVGVILTGMGRDGAIGLKEMRSRGAATLGQDEATSAVYGMPAAAFSGGAVDVQLPVDAIGPAVLSLVGRLS